MIFVQKSNNEVSAFWDTTAKWRLTYFTQLKETPDTSLSPALIAEKEFVILEEQTIERLVKDAANILELGCGVGRSILPFIQKYPQKRFVGVDFAKGQINLFNEQLRKSEANNAQGFVASVDDLSCLTMKFDLVLICNHTYGNFFGDTRKGCILEMYRLLSFDGKLMIGNFTNVDIAEECYREWNVEVESIDTKTGFIKLKHYNSFWQNEQDFSDELEQGGFLCRETKYAKLGFVKIFSKTARTAAGQAMIMRRRI
jgi:ubiquinone/menaquinone biosynthesis C-methylase UbiE